MDHSNSSAISLIDLGSPSTPPHPKWTSPFNGRTKFIGPFPTERDILYTRLPCKDTSPQISKTFRGRLGTVEAVLTLLAPARTVMLHLYRAVNNKAGISHSCE